MSKKFNINKLILVKISINLVNLNIVKNVSIKFFIYLIIISHLSIATYAVLSSYLPRAIESLANVVGKFILLTYMIHTLRVGVSMFDPTREHDTNPTRVFRVRVGP